jgi:hypothetical protein
MAEHRVVAERRGGVLQRETAADRDPGRHRLDHPVSVSHAGSLSLSQE